MMNMVKRTASLKLPKRPKSLKMLVRLANLQKNFQERKKEKAVLRRALILSLT
jgi:hypothetical protein